MPDLLHPPVAAKRFKIPKAYRIGGLCVLVVALAVFFSQKILSDKERELDALKKELKRVEPEVNAVKRKESNIHLARQWREERFPWVKFFMEISKTKLATRDLQITGMTFGEKSGVTISAKASSTEVYDSFRRELEDNPYLKNVQSGGALVPIQETPYRNKFTLKAELKPE